jgi:hypothetical protein
MLCLSVILCLLSSAFGLGSIVKEAMGLWDKVSKTPVNEPCNDIERLKCLDFLLKWRGIEIDGDCEKPLVNAGLILLKICVQCITNVRCSKYSLLKHQWTIKDTLRCIMPH